jgi:hypothetical protein
MIVLPGGGYAAHAPHEAEPVASWLSEIGVQASVFRYPLNVRHPAPLDALVTPQSPPFFVWHTAEDPYVPPEHTYRFAAALAASRVPHRRARVRPRPAWPRPGPGRWPARDLDHAGGSLDPGTGGTTGMIQLTARGPIGGAHGCINRRRPSLRQVYALPPGRRSRSCGEQLRGETNERKPAKAGSQAVLELR